MNELSIEEKARRYDEVSKEVKDFFEGRQKMYSDVNQTLEYLFPELKESEDERIRKEMIFYFTEEIPQCSIQEHSDKMREFISWLKRQEVERIKLELKAGNSYFCYKSRWERADSETFKKGLIYKCNEDGVLDNFVIKNPEQHFIEIKDERIAWLEKQGEQKPIIEMKTPEESLGIDSDTYNKIVDECIYDEQKPANKVEPKFHVNEWVVTDKNDVVQIKAVYNGYYTIDNGMGFYMPYVDRYWHKWTIQDAKDGDVLYECNEKNTFIFKELETKHIGDIASYCDIFNGIFNPNEDDWTTLDIVPATKEQRNLLFQKMHEAGYEWDAEKKELKKIKQKPIDKNEVLSILNKENRQVQQKDLIIKPSLFTEQNLAWSEEDNVMINKLLAVVKLYYDRSGNDLDKQSCISFLKSLKDRVQPQNTWKPSDEQIKVCKEVYADILSAKGFDLGTVNSELNRLEEELKKLIEE